MLNEVPDRTEEYRKGKMHLAWLFGLVAGLVFVVVVWGSDGLNLSRANGLYPWAKLALGTLPILLLCLAAAWLSSIWSNGLGSFLLWLGCGIAIAFIGGHVSFEGLTWFYRWVNPQLAVRVQYGMDSGVAARMAMTVGVCAVIGAIAGLFFNTLLENCFAAASKGAAFLNLFIWALFFAGCGVVLNVTIEKPLRDPVAAINETITDKLRNEVTPYSLSDARDLHLGALNTVTDLLHSPRRLVLLDYDDTLSTTHIGVDFDGVWVKCMVAANNYLIPPKQQPVNCERMN